MWFIDDDERGARGYDDGASEGRGGRGHGRGGHHEHPGKGRGRRGPGGEGFGPFGPGGPFGPFGAGGPGGRGGGRGRRARRGDVRHAILAVLGDGPANGYGIMKQIEERTGGFWRTSPGSVYPTLAQLVDEGLIAPAEGGESGGTTYALTEAGGTYATEHRAELEGVWGPATREWGEVGEMMTAGRKLLAALREVAENGTPEQRTQAAAKMEDLRRELYRMLAE